MKYCNAKNCSCKYKDTEYDYKEVTNICYVDGETVMPLPSTTLAWCHVTCDLMIPKDKYDETWKEISNYYS
jgi:hypothetical protein